MRKELIKLSTDTWDPIVQGELTAFQTSLTEDQMRISASGLFHVGVHLVPSVSFAPLLTRNAFIIFIHFQIIGTIITYMVILLNAPK